MENSAEGQRRFWEKVKRGNLNRCWEWIGGRNANGYGLYGISPTRTSHVGFLAHRIAFYLTYGKFPEEAHICHHCDNPPCCNPKHLYLGNPQLNNADKVAKGRQQTGMKHHMHKLTDDEVREIRRKYAVGNTSLSILAAEYGVAIGTVHPIVRRRTWKLLK